MVVTAVPDSMSSDSSRSCVLAGVGGVFRDKLNENHTHIYICFIPHTHIYIYVSYHTHRRPSCLPQRIHLGNTSS